VAAEWMVAAAMALEWTAFAMVSAHVVNLNLFKFGVFQNTNKGKIGHE
jgi:hypothetical protein